jgi:hypothetical protein
MLEFMNQLIKKRLLSVLFYCCALSNVVQAGDWMTWPSTYTHDVKGVQVDQYAMPVQPLGPNRQDYQRSGFRHFRSTLQVGQSADNYHLVEEFGRPIEPYEQWRFPYRPYGVPYDAWGPQTPFALSVGGGFGLNPGIGFGHGMHGTGVPGMPGTGMPGTGMPHPHGHPTPGYHHPGYHHPGYHHPGYGHSPLLPLQPRYQNQPWFDGTYPDAPPLNN